MFVQETTDKNVVGRSGPDFSGLVLVVWQFPPCQKYKDVGRPLNRFVLEEVDLLLVWGNGRVSQVLKADTVAEV